jgi:hypothetical protein
MKKAISILLALYHIALMATALVLSFRTLLGSLGNEFIDNNVTLTIVMAFAVFALVAPLYMGSMFIRVDALESSKKSNHNLLWFINPLPSFSGLKALLK